MYNHFDGPNRFQRLLLRLWSYLMDYQRKPITLLSSKSKLLLLNRSNKSNGTAGQSFKSQFCEILKMATSSEKLVVATKISSIKDRYLSY